MTHANTHIPEQHSPVTEGVIGALTMAMIALAGILSLVQFAAVVAS